MNNEDKSVDNFSRHYQLRPLKDKDLFTVLAIIDKIFPDEKLKEAFAIFTDESKSMEDLGVQVSYNLGVALIRNIVTAHDAIYAFLADVSGIPADRIDEMPFGTGPMMIWDIVMNAKNADFFKAVSRLL